MTLVYAQHIRNIISVVSDTGVIGVGGHVSKKIEVPKIVILNPDLCVAFSGGVDLAHGYIGDFHSVPRDTVPAVVNYFEQCSKDSSEQVDFLLMFNKPVTKIIPIIGGNRSRNMHQSAWIGDKAGFEHFQYCREHRAIPGAFPKTMFLTTSLKSEATEGNTTFANVGAMHRVVQEAKVPLVFGDAIAANNVDGYFRYRPYSVVVRPDQPHFAIPENYMRSVQPELSEDVNYALSCFASDPGATRIAVAMHHVFGKLTHLYSAESGQPLKLTDTIINTNIQQFMDAHKDGYGTWRGTVNTRRPLPMDYGLTLEPSVQTTPWTKPVAKSENPK